MLCRDARGKPSCYCQDNYERKALDICRSKNYFASQLQVRRRGELTFDILMIRSFWKACILRVCIIEFLSNSICELTCLHGLLSAKHDVLWLMPSVMIKKQLLLAKNILLIYRQSIYRNIIHNTFKLKTVVIIAGKKIQKRKTFLFVFPLN